MVDFAYSQNMKRRHLTSVQKAKLSMAILPAKQKEAKDRQIRKAVNSVTPKMEEQNENEGEAAEATAKLMGIGRQYIYETKKILKDAPDVFEIMDNPNLNMPKAKQLASLPQEIRTKAIENLSNREEGKTSVCMACGELLPLEKFEVKSGTSRCTTCRNKAIKTKNSIALETSNFEGNPEGEITFLKKKVADLELNVIALEKQLADERTRYMVERTELAGEIFTIKANLTLRGIEL